MKEAESRKRAMAIMQNDLREAVIRAEESDKRAEEAFSRALKVLMDTGLPEEEARKKLGL